MISASQFERRHSALSVNCKKVYAAVPISEPWSVSYILSEIQRLSSFTSNMRVVTGSLNALKASGLILEPEPSLFVRAPIKPPKSPDEITTTEEEDMSKAAPIEKPAKQTDPRNPMAILSELATRCKALADEIETAALEIDEYVTAKDVDAGKLKQLQALLKGLA